MVNSIWKNWNHECNSLSLYIIDYYFSRMTTFKHTTTSQRRPFNSFLLFYSFYLIVFFFIISFQTLIRKKDHVYNLYIAYSILSFCYVRYSIVSEICIGGCFLGDCVYCLSQQIISAVANVSLTLYNLIKRTLETQNL